MIVGVISVGVMTVGVLSVGVMTLSQNNYDSIFKGFFSRNILLLCHLKKKKNMVNMLLFFPEFVTRVEEISLFFKQFAPKITGIC